MQRSETMASMLPLTFLKIIADTNNRDSLWLSLSIKWDNNEIIHVNHLEQWLSQNTQKCLYSHWALLALSHLAMIQSWNFFHHSITGKYFQDVRRNSRTISDLIQPPLPFLLTIILGLRSLKRRVERLPALNCAASEDSSPQGTVVIISASAQLWMLFHRAFI